MVPNTRYQNLNRAMTALRGQDYEIMIKGADELRLKHDSVMVEACNTSFQVHLQSGAKEFPNLYNIAQALAGPLVAACSNSPLLFGRRLWSETRIALFEQAVDTRSPLHVREVQPRVTFGDRWLRRSVVEIYREDIARFRTLVGGEADEDPLAVLARGGVPELRSLRLHNGTIYRWNRACYGVLDGKPHLRIENRVMPSGPSVTDEIANAALWYGCMLGLASQHEDITKVMEFEHARANFTAASRSGLGASLVWLEGVELTASHLLLDHLLPLAEQGLRSGGIDEADRQRYLGVIERRVRSGRTGSRWLLYSLAQMKDRGTAAERLSALTSATVARQQSGATVDSWEPAQRVEAGGWKQNYLHIEQYMTTDLYTVNEDDSVELAANLMQWHGIRHVPVEDHEHKLVGLVSYRSLLRLLTSHDAARGADSVPVSEVMRRDPFTISPSTSTMRAIALMHEHNVGCLPVVQRGRLVGMVTAGDFADIASQLLEQRLAE
jgi:CBS domain-containing protein